MIATFKIKNINDNELILENETFNLNKLKVGELYDFDIKKHIEKRSLRQNRLLWKMIKQINDEMNAGGDDFDVYIQALELSNAKYEYIMALPKSELVDELKKSFRAVQLKYTQEIDGKLFGVYKCFIGSSKMNKQEMNILIDNIFKMAIEVGIDVDEYMELKYER